MELEPRIPGLAALRAHTEGGHPSVTIAVLDGPADLDHPGLRGADIRIARTLAGHEVGTGQMARHATFVTGVVFGRPGTAVEGIAPACRGVLVPVFSDRAPRASQLDLARAVEQALAEGADVISISGGQPVPAAQIDPLLARALARCAEQGVLVVAAVGNDGAARDQVPAAVSSVLAVGAHDAAGVPLAANNRGPGFAGHAVLAPGREIPGAVPGGGVEPMTGSSVATPIVAAIAALLFCEARAEGTTVDERAVRPADVGPVLARTALGCPDPEDESCGRHLGGRIDIPRARRTLVPEGDHAVDGSAASPSTVSEPAEPPAADLGPSVPGPLSSPAPGLGATPLWPGHPGVMWPPAAFAAFTPAPGWAGAGPAGWGGATPPAGHAPAAQYTPAVTPAAGCGCGGETGAPAAVPSAAGPPAQAAPAHGGGLIYAIGTIGVDFGTEARRDGFRQQMGRDPRPPSSASEPREDVAANPYDPHQLRRYLVANPWASDKLIWTLNLDRTPIYALVAETPVGMTWERLEDVKATDVSSISGALEQFAANPPVSTIYKTFRDALVGQIRDVDDRSFISRVSIPGLLTGRTVRLFSGQVLPVVEVKARGVHTWNEPVLVTAVTEEVTKTLAKARTSATTTQRTATEAEPTEAELTAQEAKLRQNIHAFLDKIYIQFRNLGQSPQDRALNYAGTNAFMITQEIQDGLLSGSYVPGTDQSFYTLDTISVARSPYCRMDSDCWDVSVRFFDPENERRARVTYLFTIDVSDELPVSLAPAHRFLGN